MLEPFLIAFREAFQCSIILSILLIYPRIADKKGYCQSLITGVTVSFILGFMLGYVPYFSKRLWSNETWTFWRYIFEAAIFYSSVIPLAVRINFRPFLISAGLFFLGFFIFFFEARAVGFLVRDMGAMKGNLFGFLSAGLTGAFAGFVPLTVFMKRLRKISSQQTFALPGILVFIGALKFAFGGTGELEKGDFLVTLQNGLINFLGDAIKYIQSTLLIQEHPFIKTPFVGLARFLSGDRTAMTLMVIFIMTPPLLILINLFARPDPILNGTEIKAKRRLMVAFFRKELIYQAMPLMLSLFIIIILIHAVNISINPMYDPDPIPVREAEDHNKLIIPLSDKLGDLKDGKLRKYVYYYGNRQILFLAVLKPDGSLGVALDQCEICRPAEWNKSAQGYAQRGGNLVCKYCMTPIPLPTVNNPGGCNPIPLPFSLDNSHIVISVKELINTSKNAEELEKKGTHL